MDPLLTIAVAALSALIVLYVVKATWRPYIAPAAALIAGAAGAWLITRGRTGTDESTPHHETREPHRTTMITPPSPPAPLPDREEVDHTVGGTTQEMSRTEWERFLRETEEATRRHLEDL